MGEVERYYDGISENEWERLERHKIEFDITRRYMDRFIDEQSKILDVGGGPGRYAIYLAKKNNKVTLLDLSVKNIELARRNAKIEGVELEDYIHCNALNLSKKISDTFDVVLCMGPLYHLTEEKERKKVMNECIKRLKPGGILFASFISAYAPIIDFIKNYPQNILGFKENLLNYLEDGRNIVSSENPGFTTAYFINPSDINKFMTNFALQELVIAGVEGIPSQSEEKINSLSEEAYSEWLDIIYKSSTNPMTWATCEHFLYIGRKL